MSLSFEESKKQLMQQAATPMMMSARPATMALNQESDMIAAYSGEEWTRVNIEGYRWFENYVDLSNNYVDDKFSFIETDKSITVDISQVNISQETNSQFIPFEMYQKYDGIDLTDMPLAIHYTRSDGTHGISIPVNVVSNGEKIRFAWLVDSEATRVAGNLKFEVHATGNILDSNKKSYPYRWQSKSTDKFIIVPSLCISADCEDDIVADEDWLQHVVDIVTTTVADQITNAQISSQVEAAEKAASDAAISADNAASAAETAVNNILINGNYATQSFVEEEIGKIDIPDKVSDLENDKNYATEQYVTDAIAAEDITNKLTAYAKTEYVNTLVGDLKESESVVGYVDAAVKAIDVTDQLANYALKTDLNGLATETFVSDKLGQIVDIEGNPTSVDKYVEAKIEAIDVSDQLGDLTDEDGNERTVKQYVDDAVGAVDVSEQLKDYATKVSLGALETSLETVRGNTVTNATNIANIQNNITDIQSSLSSLGGDNQNLIIQYSETGSLLYLYERDENGNITITDGDQQIKVKQIYSTVITGGGGGGNALVSKVKLNLSNDGKDSFAVLHGNDVYLNYNLSTRVAKETQNEDGEDVTVYEENYIAGDITFTLYKDNVYLTHFTVQKNSVEVKRDSIDITEYVTLGRQIFSVVASYVEKLGVDGETITVTDDATWAVEAVNLGVTDLPDSNWELEPKYGSVTIPYTPIGAWDKTIYFKIDNNEPTGVPTSLNGTTLSYTIPKQTHGVHTLQVWCEGIIEGTTVKTEPYKYVLMFVEQGNNTPIIRIKAPTTLEQYSSAYIYYNVFDPLSAIIKSVTVYDEDGVVLSSKEDITSVEQKLEFKPSVVKDKTITVQYKETTESVTIKVTKFPYEINAVTGDLMVDFVPTGRSNSDIDYKVFKNNAYTIERDSETGEETRTEIPMTWTFSDNFDWINGGWKTDANGDTYFCVKAGTSVDINYNLFGSSGVVAKKDANGDYTIAGTGKEFKLIFKTTNVAQANTTWLECVDVADKKSLGIRMEAQNAYIDSGLGTLEIPYVDDDIIEFDMNIVPVTDFLEGGEPNLKTKSIPMIMTYEDGTPVQPKVISSVSTNFKQDEPKPITIGSPHCDVHIYRLKVYERYLEDKEIITNFIADARSGAEMAKRYLRNDIYPVENRQKITPESVAAACPDLKVYILSAPYFTNDKGNKVANTTIQQIHNTGTKEKPEYDNSENWIATGATHNGQGTSSNEYGYSGRNLEFNLKKATITLNDNTTVVKKIQLSPTSYPTNYLNFKINIASSESANNALLQKRYDRYLPYTSVASLIDDRKKNSMEFFNCVVFIQETDPNVATHREFSDTDIHFYGIGNIGDSKKTDDTRVNDPDDPSEFCVEIMDWNRELSSFPMDTMVPTDTFYIDDEGNQVFRFADFLVDENLGAEGILYEKDAQGNYNHSMDTTIDKSKTYYLDILENDDFSEDYTYGFRYIQSEWKEEDDPNYKELNETFQAPLRQKWIDFYRFVTRDLTTNGKEDNNKIAAWKSEFSNWFITESALYYYLYTLRYTMVDNRAKNTFWHWGKHYLTLEEALNKGIAVYDADKNLITDSSNTSSKFYNINGDEIKNINAAAAAINDGYRMEFWAYDNDTALGIDNAGKLEIPIGVEENDEDPAGVPYFRAHDSLVFARIAKYFVAELENMWHTTEISPVGKVFDSITFIDEFDVWQSQFPEELWRIDYERKYKRTYVGGTGKDWDNALPQSNKSDIDSKHFLTEMMNGRKKYQRRCFERNQEIYMSSKFKGEVNLGDTITLRGTGMPKDKVVPPNFTLNITPFSKMYVNLYNATDSIYYHTKLEAGEPASISYPNTTLDFIYIRGASQIQSLGDLSPMYLQTATLTAGAKLKTITLGNATTGYVNDSLKTLQIGAGNKLLEELDIRNLNNLDDTNLPVANIPSLKRVYAQGSNITEATFANSGLLEEAYLPATISRLELRNLHYLKTISLESYENLLHLVVMNCSDIMNSLVLDMIDQAPDLQTLRLTNIDWTLSDATVLDRLHKLIKTADSPEVVLSGKVHIGSLYEQPYYQYKAAWPDLDITWDNFTPQYVVTFVNTDGTVLETQYVVQNQKAEDPTKRLVDPMPTPTQESTVSTRYEFTGWDIDFTKPILKNTTAHAQYNSITREYTIKYVSDDNTLQEDIVPYGTVVPYRGETPTNTSGESDNSNTYRLFKCWSDFGYVDGDKTIEAIFDTCICVGDYFEGKDLSDLKPFELYAMTKMQEAKLLDITDYVDVGDTISVTLGHDIRFGYDDTKDPYSKQLISTRTDFVSTNKQPIDTEELLLSEDRDFVLAIDFKMTGTNSNNAVLAQCYSDKNSLGFQLMYNNAPKMKWGSDSITVSSANRREMVVIRHVKGESTLHVYSSNVAGSSITVKTLTGFNSMSHNNSLVFGGCKMDDGSYERYATGTIYWSKLWYVDLGDEMCSQLASWPHEELELAVCYQYDASSGTTGLTRYYLSNDELGRRSSMTFVAANTLSHSMPMNITNTNTGGWAASNLREYLNNRVYDAFSDQWKQLLKQVEVKSTIGDKSTTLSTSDCHIFIPSIAELGVNTGTSPYDTEGSHISQFTSTGSRICKTTDGTAVDYWTRSPSIGNSTSWPYFYRINATGGTETVSSANTPYHVRIMFSI